MRQLEAITTVTTLTEAQKQVLQAQVIDDLHPGAILRDFQVVLDRIGAGGVKAAGKYNLLPIELIPELDTKLHRPLQLALTMKRPQLRSHPYLQGLHLLLRSSGLTRVEGSGAKARLVVDPAALASWNRLNPTEHYFNLLEAWLIFGRAEMVGERASSWDKPFLQDCLFLWRFLARQRDRILYRSHEGYLVALFDLFGLLEVKFPRQPVQPWSPAGVKVPPFGKAMTTILHERFERSLGWLQKEEDEPEEEEEDTPFGFGSWQRVFQPYFPDWKHNLVLPEEEMHEGVWIFRVSLGEVWRRIAIDADSNLDRLVSIILSAFNFSSEHLYQFTYRNQFGVKVTVGHPQCDEDLTTDEMQVGELPLKPGQAMDLHYDFGDDWHFDVKLEGIEPPRAGQKLPKVLEKHGKAPQQYPRYW